MADRPQCPTGCGFFGSNEFAGMCSACFRKHGGAIEGGVHSVGGGVAGVGHGSGNARGSGDRSHQVGGGRHTGNSGNNGYGGGSGYAGGSGYGGGGGYGGYGSYGGHSGDGGYGFSMDWSPKKASGEDKTSELNFEMSVPIGSTSETAVIQCRHGDMTEEDVDAIVNAANQSLDHASGLAGAIVKKGGRIIQDESDDFYHQHGKLEVGELHVTSSGLLKARHIFHVVGPIWRGGMEGEELLLQVAVRNVLEKADMMKLKSISLPAISSGIFNFPKKKCAEIIIDMSIAHLTDEPNTTLREIRLCNFDDETVGIFETQLRAVAAKRSAGGSDSSNSEHQQAHELISKPEDSKSELVADKPKNLPSNERVNITPGNTPSTTTEGDRGVTGSANQEGPPPAYTPLDASEDSHGSTPAHTANDLIQFD